MILTVSFICLLAFLLCLFPISNATFRCPLGERLVGVTRLTCSPCPPNMYGDDGYKCSPCPPSSFTASSSAPAQSIGECLCPAGYYAVDHGRSNMTCSACPKNTFSPAAGAIGSDSCSSCNDFVKELASPAAISCPCKSGYYWDSNTVRCTPCSAGSYSAIVNATQSSACTLCPPGRYGKSSGATSCPACSYPQFTSADGSTSCKNCDIFCDNDSSGLCNPKSFIPNQFATTCRFDGPLCLYDKVDLIAGTAIVSELTSGIPLTLDMSQSWAISAWFLLESKHDRQTLFSFMATNSSSAGNLVVTIHPQNLNHPVSLRIATGAPSRPYIVIAPFFATNPFMLNKPNWVYINYDRVSSLASLSFTVNNRTSVDDINLNEMGVSMIEMSTTTTFQIGSANLASFNPLTGGKVYGARLYTNDEFVKSSAVRRQSLFPTASALALGCPSDISFCPKRNQRSKMPTAISFETLPYCVCVDGYYDEPESNECIPCPANSYCKGNIRTSCPPHLPLSEPLASTNSQCSANATEQFITPIGMPNIDMAGRGYDLLMGNPLTTFVEDPGLRGKVVDLSYFGSQVSDDQRFVIPNGTEVFNTMSCKLDFSSTVMSSTIAYKKELEAKVSVEVETTSYSFQGSTEYKSVDEGSTNRGSTFTSTHAECSVYTVHINAEMVSLHPVFSDYVRGNILKLADRTNETHWNAAAALVQEFGSHFPSEVVMGSRYGEILEISQEYVKKSSNRKLAVEAKASASLAVASGSISASFSSDRADESEFSKGVTNRFVFSFGSQPPANGEAGTWAAQSFQNPAIIRMRKLKPITRLVTPENFPDIPPTLLSGARDSISDYLVKRCPHCTSQLDDYDVCFGGFILANQNGGLNTLTSVVGCPNGYAMSPELLPENNMWGIQGLRYCYHKTRCKTRLPSAPPSKTGPNTNDFTSFGGAFSRFIYFSNSEGEDHPPNDVIPGRRREWEAGQEIELLTFLTKDDAPLVDLARGDNWVDWYDNPAAYIHLDQGEFIFDGRQIDTRDFLFVRPFDDLRFGGDSERPAQRSYFKSNFKLTGNALNGNKFSCAEGFVEFFLGIFYTHRGEEAGCKRCRGRACDYCGRRRRVHAALFICIAAEMSPSMAKDQQKIKRATMPVSVKQCGVKYTENAKVDLMSGECSYPEHLTPFHPRGNGSLPIASKESNSGVSAHMRRDLPGFDGRYIHDVLNGGDYTPVNGASIGGVFARGDDLSINIPLDPEFSFSKMYITAEKNWMFNGDRNCPPGYKEYVLFSTNPLASTPHQEWIHQAGKKADVIICLLTSRTAYETATLGSADVVAALQSTVPALPPMPTVNWTFVDFTGVDAFDDVPFNNTSVSSSTNSTLPPF